MKNSFEWNRNAERTLSSPVIFFRYLEDFFFIFLACFDTETTGAVYVIFPLRFFWIEKVLECFVLRLIGIEFEIGEKVCKT